MAFVKQSERGNNSSFWDVCWLDRDLMIFPDKVNFRE